MDRPNSDLRSLKFICGGRCHPYCYYGILVPSQPRKGTCRDLSLQNKINGKKKQGKTWFSTGSFLLLPLYLIPPNSDVIDRAQARPKALLTGHLGKGRHGGDWGCPSSRPLPPGKTEGPAGAPDPTAVSRKLHRKLPGQLPLSCLYMNSLNHLCREKCSLYLKKKSFPFDKPL